MSICHTALTNRGRVEIQKESRPVNQTVLEDFMIDIRHKITSQQGRIEALENELRSMKTLKTFSSYTKKESHARNTSNVKYLEEIIAGQRQRIKLLEKELNSVKQKGNRCPKEITGLPHFLSKTDKLVWGAEKFFKGKQMDFDLYGSYENWYSNITKIMRNTNQYQSKDFVFIRKNLERHYTEEYLKYKTESWRAIYFISKRKNTDYAEGMSYLIVEGFGSELWEKGVFLLLHPTNFEKCLEFDRYSRDKKGNNERWIMHQQTPDYYWGDSKSVIIFGFLNKNDY